MIQNLNQISLRGFGTILPSKDDPAGISGAPYPLLILDKRLPLQRTVSPTKLCCEKGPVILSVRRGSEPFRHLYMDKAIVLEAGLDFYLSALNPPCKGKLWTDVPPKHLGFVESVPQLHIQPKLQINKLYTFFYQEKEQGFLFPGESHPMLELTYVDQGSIHSVADGQDLLLKQGEMVLYAPDQWHMQYADIGIAPRFVTLSFEAEGLPLDMLTNRVINPSQYAISLLRQMLKEQETADDYAQDMVLNLLSQLLVTLLRSSTEAEPLRSAHCLNNENAIIRRAQQYISANVRKALSVPLVAKNSDVSPSYLTSLFHKHLQISPGEYIRRIKLQESKQMIREGNMNFTQIAQELHYSTIHHFSRQFKEKFGVSPSEYAKSIR